MTSAIDIKLWSDDEAYWVQIGPDDHVCSHKQAFRFNDCNRADAYWAALHYKRGAAAALDTAAGLASRFIRGGAVIDKTPRTKET